MRKKSAQCANVAVTMLLSLVLSLPLLVSSGYFTRRMGSLEESRMNSPTNSVLSLRSTEIQEKRNGDEEPGVHL